MDKSTAALAKAMALGLGAALAYLMASMAADGSLAQYLNYSLFGKITLIAGLALAGMVGLLGYSMAFGKAEPCCGHDHGDDGHDHAHGVSLWRLMVLVIPVTLLAMGWAPQTLSAAAMRARMSESQKLAENMELPAGLSDERMKAAKNAKIRVAKTKDLFDDAKQPDTRAYWESVESPRAVELIGQFLPSGRTGRYQLNQPKMTCCAQDATPVMVVVKGIPPADWRESNWVKIQGLVAFQEDEAGKSWVPVVYAGKQDKLDGPPPGIFN